MFMTDRVSVSAPRRTADGYLVADAKVARTGIQQYLGSELGRSDMPVVRVYRPESEVFAQDTMRSYAYRPMTVGHPGKMVDADSWRGVAVGQTGSEVVRDGEFVRVPLVMMDSGAVKEFESGKRELSMGYTAEIVFKDGVTPEGEPYDAIQTQLRMNHLALVDRARGGGQLRIGDDNNPSKRKPPMSDTKTVLVDGLSVVCTDAGAQAIGKLQGQLNDAKSASDKLVTDHATAIAAKDAEVSKLEAERDDLKAKVLSDADLDKRVNDRADLVAIAKAIHDADYAGKSDADIRKAAVVGKLGDAAIKDKPDAYVQARFDILAEDAKKDPVNKALRDGARAPSAANDNGYADSVAAFNPQKKES